MSGDARQALETLCGLSLLSCVGAERYRLHDLLRAFAHDELRAAAEEAAVRQRQVQYFLGFVRGHKEDYDALEAEWGNVQGVLEWLEGQQGAVSSKQAAGSHEKALMDLVEGVYDPVVGLLGVRCYWREGIRWGDAAAEAARVGGDESAVARFAGNVGSFHYLMGDLAEARRRHEAALEVCRRLKDESNVAVALHQLGMLAQAEGHYGEAQRLYEESLALRRKLGDVAGIAASLHQLGNVAYLQGRYGEARRLYEESLALRRKLGEVAGIAGSLHNLGALAQAEGHYGEARRLYEEAGEAFKKLGALKEQAAVLHQLGMLAGIDGKLEEAADLFQQSLEIFERLHSPDAATARKSLDRVRKKVGK